MTLTADERKQLMEFMPEEERLIRIKDTDMSRRMGIANWEGTVQGYIEEYGLFFFCPSGTLPGDKKIAMYAPWFYVHEKE